MFGTHEKKKEKRQNAIKILIVFMLIRTITNLYRTIFSCSESFYVNY